MNKIYKQVNLCIIGNKTVCSLDKSGALYKSLLQCLLRGKYLFVIPVWKRKKINVENIQAI